MGDKLNTGKEIQCPAGEAVNGGCALRCRIEGVLMRSPGEKSIDAFCTGETTENKHYRCPSWRAFKDLNLLQEESAARARKELAAADQKDDDVLEDARERGWLS